MKEKLTKALNLSYSVDEKVNWVDFIKQAYFFSDEIYLIYL